MAFYGRERSFFGKCRLAWRERNLSDFSSGGLAWPPERSIPLGVRARREDRFDPRTVAPADCGSEGESGRAETVIRELEQRKPGANVLQEKKAAVGYPADQARRAPGRSGAPEEVRLRCGFRRLFP
ncbi:hypothetical protein MPNT_20014 [Candidatus Methylacidithermus pantelleriae]|uniref:Uncharacterized protein n=1 Tax=Candidatus Methylacidithermus pantelleriae TaxID=2744239 RepID=A0A8J2BHQ9_9BACT|nr:hypothetical protein MPNT_20014 [Candidatus Methylacidithermus pantelleriae]